MVKMSYGSARLWAAESRLGLQKLRHCTAILSLGYRLAWYVDLFLLVLYGLLDGDVV
jgi:hypothetical protein